MLEKIVVDIKFKNTMETAKDLNYYENLLYSLHVKNENKKKMKENLIIFSLMTLAIVIVILASIFTS